MKTRYSVEINEAFSVVGWNFGSLRLHSKVGEKIENCELEFGLTLV